MLSKFCRQEGQLLEFCSHLWRQGWQQIIAWQHLGTTPFLAKSLQTTQERICFSWTDELVDCRCFNILVWLSNKQPTQDGSAGIALLLDIGVELGSSMSAESEEEESTDLWGRLGLILNREYWSAFTAFISFGVFQNLAPVLHQNNLFVNFV